MLRDEAFQILGIKDTNDKDAVKKAFRKKAAQLHPDKNPDNPNAEGEFKKVNEAYRIASENQQPEDVYPNINQETFSRMNVDFTSIFGKGFRRTQQSVQKFEVKRLTKQLTFEESVLGGECKLKYNIKKYCKECEGGNKNKQVCLSCGGEGAIHNVNRKVNFAAIFTEFCEACNGTGMIPGDCKGCNSKGYVTFSKNVNLKIPPIGDKRVALRLAKAGNIYYVNGREEYGDVILDLVPNIISPDGKMKIVGNNVLSKHQIRLDTLMYGGEVEVQTVSGKQKLNIPKKSRAGSILHIKGYGVHAKHNIGNHLVELEIEYPKQLTEEFKKAIEKAYKD